MSRGPTHDGKGNKRRGKGSGRKFVQMDVGMMCSPAWRSLSGNAAKVFMDMARSHWAFNGELAYSGGQAGEVINRDRSTGSRALRELEAKGFIVREVPAHIGATGRKACTWRLTPFPIERNGKQTLAPTRDYQRWRPPEKTSQKRLQKQKRCSTSATNCVTSAHNPVVIDLSERLRVTSAT